MSVRAPPPLSGAQKSLQNGPTSPSAAVTKLLPQTPPSWPGRLPSLHLYPLSADSVGPRAIYLPPDGTRVKIGRGTSAKTQPAEGNAYFETKVFSRNHAEVWQEEGRMLIRDVKSSNGTFVNGERLSAEGVESDPCPLVSGDEIQFGIDIADEAGAKVLHHKVVTKAFCVFSKVDVEPAYRELTVYQAAQQRDHRRAAKGPSVEDLTRHLQLELQRSRDAASDLQGLRHAVEDVQETLAGGIPPPSTTKIHPNYPPKTLPPEDVQSLHRQISETQSALEETRSRFALLSRRLSEQESLRLAVDELRARLEGLQSRQNEVEDAQDGDDDDDGASVMTVGRWSGRSGIGKEEREAEFLKDADEIPSSGRRGGADGDEQEAASVSFFGRASTSEPGSPPPQRTSAPVAQDDEEDSFLLQPRQHPTNGASSPLLDHLRYQLSTQHSTTQLVLAQNETLALRVESLEVQQGEALSSLGPLKSRLAELEAKESRWETSLAKEKVALEADRETMRRAVKEWEEGRKREKEEREERRLNEALGVGGEKRVDPPTATLRPDHNDHNPTFKLRASSSPSLIRSPSRPRRAPVPSVFKTPLVRSLSSEGTLRPTTSPLAASSATLEGPPSTLPLPLKDLDEPNPLTRTIYLAAGTALVGALFLSSDAAAQVGRLLSFWS